MRGKIVAHFFAHDGLDMLRMKIAENRFLAHRAEALGELAAIRSEEYAAEHPKEIARRRHFFRRVLGESRSSGRLEVGASMIGSSKSIRSLW